MNCKRKSPLSRTPGPVSSNPRPDVFTWACRGKRTKRGPKSGFIKLRDGRCRQRARLGGPKAITATPHKLARILYNLMRHGIAYMKKEELAYAEQVRERLEKQLHRRARELGYELKKIQPALQTLVMPDGEVVTVNPDGEIVNA
jgi:hypothetical protein